jgi:hypothetical protein
VRVGFEALVWGRHINDYRQAWEAVRHADHEHVFHILARRLPVDDIGEIPAQRVVLVHHPMLLLGEHVLDVSAHGRLPCVRPGGTNGHRPPLRLPAVDVADQHALA